MLALTEAAIFALRECVCVCVCRVSVVDRFTLRGDCPGSPVWHLPLFSKSMLIKIVLFSLLSLILRLKMYGRCIEDVRVEWPALEGRVGSRSVTE